MEKVDSSQKRLLESIEKMRNQLSKMVRIHKSFTHPEVLQLSQELDTLLNRLGHEKGERKVMETTQDDYWK